jgi:hypothetical protein
MAHWLPLSALAFVAYVKVHNFVRLRGGNPPDIGEETEIVKEVALMNLERASKAKGPAEEIKRLRHTDIGKEIVNEVKPHPSSDYTRFLP